MISAIILDILYPNEGITMAKAVWNGIVLAESDKYEIVEGNVYFPEESIKKQYFKKSDKNTVCFWKGVASYYTINANGRVNKDAAWYYPNPTQAAKKIINHIAFWKGVQVER